jgi:hypothetical protein
VSGRALALGVLSLAAAIALLVALASHGAISSAAVLRALAAARPERVAVLGLLAAFLAFLSAERWRMIERRTAGAAPSHLRAFALTAVGVGLGQLLPVQLATAISRAIGARLLKPAASPRPVVVTFYEQAFDVGVALLLAGASAAYLLAARHVAWLVFAIPALVVGYAAAGFAATLLGWLFRAMAGRSRAGAWMGGLAEAELFCPQLARRLVLVSMVRFAVTALMAGVTSWATGLAIGLPELTIALPLVVLATAAPLTPAGLGVNEWTFAGALALQGTPLALAAQWALVNRVLVFAVSAAIGTLALPLLAVDAARHAAPATAPGVNPSAGRS